TLGAVRATVILLLNIIVVVALLVSPIVLVRLLLRNVRFIAPTVGRSCMPIAGLVVIILFYKRPCILRMVFASVFINAAGVVVIALLRRIVIAVILQLPFVLPMVSIGIGSGTYVAFAGFQIYTWIAVAINSAFLNIRSVGAVFNLNTVQATFG